MLPRKLIVTALALGLSGFAQEQARAQEQAKIRHIPAPDTDPASGAEMYRAYCAVCHGADGKGNGPAASALKRLPPDLTQLSKQNGGKFPLLHVTKVIQGEAPVVAHGSKEMPMWGDVFRDLKRDESVVTLRVHNLTQYLADLQEK